MWNSDQVDSAPKTKNTEDLKIFAYPEMVLYENIQTEEVFEVWEIISRGVTRTTYRKRFQAIGSFLSAPM